MPKKTELSEKAEIIFLIKIPVDFFLFFNRYFEYKNMIIKNTTLVIIPSTIILLYYSFQNEKAQIFLKNSQEKGNNKKDN